MINFACLQLVALLSRVSPVLPFIKYLKMLSASMKAACYFCLLIYILAIQSSMVMAATKDSSTFGITNYAFASYIGTGFYSTSGQDVFVFQLPFKHIIKEETDEEAGWRLNLPLTLGFINFSGLESEELPELDDVGTITFLPGIEYRKKITSDWTLIPFADYGFARDFNHTNNILIIGLGIKSYVNFHTEDGVLTLGNRFLYARESKKETDSNSDYTRILTGLNYRFDQQAHLAGNNLGINLYYANYYYPDDLVFLERTTSPIRVGYENEIGFTIDNISNFLFFSELQLGFGVRFGNDIRVYRLLFSAPF